MLEAPAPCSLLDHQMLLHHGQGQSERTPLSRGLEGQELGTLSAVPCQGHAVPPYSQAYAGSGRNAGLFCALPQKLKLPFFQHVKVAHAGVIGCLAPQLVEQLVRQPKGHRAQHVLLLLHVPQWELRIVQRWPMPVLGQLAQDVPLARDLVLSLAGKSSHVFDMAGAWRQRLPHPRTAGLLPGQKRSWSGADCRFELAAACRLAPSAGRRGRACPAAYCSEATVACSPTVHIQKFCTLELKPTTLNPKLCTLNPKTQTLPGAGP